jgi:hypothetical protein
VEGFYNRLYSSSFNDGFDTYEVKLHAVGIGLAANWVSKPASEPAIRDAKTAAVTAAVFISRWPAGSKGRAGPAPPTMPGPAGRPGR